MNQKTMNRDGMEEDAPAREEAEQAQGTDTVGDAGQQSDAGEGKAEHSDVSADQESGANESDSADQQALDEEHDLEQATHDDLVNMILDSRKQLDAVKDGYVRARAEVENIQRRSQNEIVSARKYAIEGFAEELLSVVDSLDQASRVELDDTAGEAVLKMKEGLELTLKQLARVMEKFGISAVEAGPGVKFDPEIHQAVSMVPGGEIPPDHIVQVMQQGFMLKDRLLRPAMVMIAAA